MCEQVVCGQVGCDEEAGAGRRQAGVHHQKQEPHTKMWGKIPRHWAMRGSSSPSSSSSCLSLSLSLFLCLFLSFPFSFSFSFSYYTFNRKGNAINMLNPTHYKYTTSTTSATNITSSSAKSRVRIRFQLSPIEILT